MPKVSIIVPVYNVEKYLNKCIDSILNQTFSDYELILVDDGSPDKSGEICDEYAKTDKRIKVIHKENGGVSEARNVGIDESVGEYIMFVDSDDWLEKNALELLVRDYDFSIGGCKALTLRHVFYYTLEEAFMNSEAFTETIIKETQKENIIFLTPWAKLYRASIIKNNLIKFDQTLKMTEDTKFNYEYFRYIKTAYCSNKIVYNYYRKNESCATGKYYDDYFYYKQITHNKLAEWLADEKYEQFLLYDLGEVVYSTIYHIITHCKKSIAVRNIDKLYNENIEDFKTVIQYVDKRLGGGYMEFLKSRKWEALVLRWKRKNIKRIIKNKIKEILARLKY